MVGDTNVCKGKWLEVSKGHFSFKDTGVVREGERRFRQNIRYWE